MLYTTLAISGRFIPPFQLDHRVMPASLALICEIEDPGVREVERSVFMIIRGP